MFKPRFNPSLTPKKYRPSRAEQGLYTVRRVGEALPLPPSPEVLAHEQALAKEWANIPKEAKGIQKRNLKRLGPRVSP